MKRIIERTEKLPSFSCDIDQLESLIDKIKEQFGGNKVSSSISIELKSEKLDFADTSDVRAHRETLPSRVTRFSIWIDEIGNKRLSIFAGGLFSPAEVTAESSDTAWCAGVTEICKDFAQRNRLWYSAIHRLPLYWLFFAFLYVPYFILSIALKKTSVSVYVVYGWFFALLSLGILALARKYAFPSAVIILRPEKATWRQYVPELSLAVAIISIILTIIGIVVQFVK